ncbi:ABC transporter substrate-binding protein [Salibacterium halotolerans]|uniref:Raffinose/stachyose/melibiose transport system substrate-binding protein n=1 Tax=Salibacterium halotolerans TaxID=1884432 RepID=A0A1I5PS19_9BACI|nr:ABC transporter substrate-binding protein [Salibacterium halotolerans]SFP36341.1 raffinose/stachyose/melibiose transport system substrate-binding protein [Salibacterium halotolerans]
MKTFSWVSVSSALLLSVGLIGCSGGESSSSDGGSGGGDEPVELEFLVADSVNTRGLEAVAEAAEEELNISVTFDIRPGGPEGENVVKTRLATGEIADMMIYNAGALLETINPTRNFVDLSEEPYMDKMMENYKETVSFGDGVYGVPSQSSNVGGWLYNKTIYEELGLEIPETWDELMENMQAVKDAGYTAAVGAFDEISRTQIPVLADYYNVQKLAPDFAEEYTAGDAKFADTPAALRSFEKAYELGPGGNDFYNEDFNATTHEQGMAMLATGEAAHFANLSNVLPTIEDNHPKQVENIGIFPQPADGEHEPGFTVWMPNAILISQSSENKEAAKKWVEFYMSDEGQRIFAENFDSIGPYVVEGVEIPDDAYAAVKQMQPYFDEGRTAPALEFVSPIKGANLPQILSEVGGGFMSPEEGAEMYDQDAERQAQQLGIEDW